MSNKPIPDIVIEQYLLEELPRADRLILEQTPGFAERLAELQADNDAFANRYPPEIFARRIENQFQALPTGSRRNRNHGRRIVILGLPAAALVALIIALVGGVGPTVSVSEPIAEVTRLKGAEPALQIFRATGSDAQRLEDGERADAGDVLQIAYNAADSAYGMICSVDGNGVVTLHFPVSSSREPALETGGLQQLQYAYRLDDAPRFEKFFFVTSAQPFSVGEVLLQFERQANLVLADQSEVPRLEGDLSILTFTVSKGE